MEERKSKLIAGLLGIFLGNFGVHNFYLGYKARAIIQVSVTCGSFVMIFVVGLLSFPLMFVYGLGLLTMLLGELIVLVAVIGIRIWTLVEGIVIIAGGIKVDGRGIPLKE